MTPSHCYLIAHLICEGEIVAVEVKSGNATRNFQQLSRDEIIETEGGVPVGKKAPFGLRDRKRTYRVIERNFDDE